MTRFAPADFKESRRHLADLLGVLLLTGIGAYLRFTALGKPPLWMDEASSAAIARTTHNDFVFLLLARELNMAPYYLLLRAIPALTRSEFALRLVPAIFGILLIPIMWVIAMRVLPGTRARGAAFLVSAATAVSGFLLTYSQEARAYSIALFFLAAAFYFCIRAVQDGEGALAWTLCALLAFYDHFFTALWLIPQGVFVWRAYRANGRSLRGPLLLLAVGLLPLLLFLFHTRGGQLDWVPHLSFAVVGDIARQLGGYSIVSTSILFAAAAIGAALFFLDRDRTSRLVLTQALLPPAALLIVSIAHPVFVPRFLIFWIPALFLCAARASEALSPVLTVAAAAPFFAALVSAKWHRPPRPDWRSTTTYLCSQENRSDAIFFSPAMAKFPFEYYLAQHPGCTPNVLPGSLELTEQDWLYGKRHLAQQACASSAQHPVLVVDGTEAPSSDALTGSCYREVARTERDRLLLVQLERNKP